MTKSGKVELCRECKALIGKGRYEKPHPSLRLTKRGEPYGHMFGGGVDSWYVCDVCGTDWFHSTDRADFGWQVENSY